MLLIDELNRFGSPLDSLASNFIKSWLDRENYYVVFTSHIPLLLDDHWRINFQIKSHIVSESDRDVVTVGLPRSTNKDILARMPGCEGLTPLQVTLYAGIPSLIYNQLNHGNPSVDERFSTRMRNMDLTFQDKQELLRAILAEFVTGNMTAGCGSLASFADYLDKDHRMWPLCYMKCILTTLGFTELAGIFNAINVYAASAESGKDWEMISLVNFYILALNALYNPILPESSAIPLLNRGPLNIADGPVSAVEFITIPSEYRTLEQLKTYLDAMQLVDGKITILTPVYSGFPLIDGLVGYAKESDGRLVATWKAFQNKLSRRYPTRNVPSWIAEAILLCGRASPRTSGPRDINWTYYNKSEMKNMLCYSLRPLYPEQWGSYPETDAFENA